MNQPLKLLSAGVFFFLGSQGIEAQKKKDSLSERNIETVVVLGYGKTSTKSKSSTASTTISAETLENRPNVSFLNSLQGTASGVSVTSSSGSPGSGKINVRIRGMASLGASDEPLYVIDGIVSSSTEYRNLNPNDIETVSILKDAQATSIYGNFGANGVVVITTKSAAYNSGVKISYDASTSFSRLPKHKYNLASGKEQLLIQHRLKRKNPANPLLGETFATEEDILKYNALNTDWEKEFFRTGATQEHNLAIRYGTQNLSSYVSLGYLKNEGIVRNTDFQRFTLRSNTNGRSNNRKFTYSTQIGLSFSKRNQLRGESTAYNDIANLSYLHNPLQMSVYAPRYTAAPRFADGKAMYEAIGVKYFGDNTPYLAYDTLLQGGTKNHYTQTSITANATGTYKLTDALSVTNKTGISYNAHEKNLAETPNSYMQVYQATQNGVQYGGWEFFNLFSDATFNSITSLNFNKKWGGHTLSVAGYIDYLRAFSQSRYFRQTGLNATFWEQGTGLGYVPFNPADPNKYVPQVTASKITGGTLALFGTVDYDYKSKYGISGTVRRDGSYRFSDGKKWDTFWSVAGRWNIDKENFLEDSAFNLLKLRASYGTNGNQNIIPVTNNSVALLESPSIVRSVYASATGYNNSPRFYASLNNPYLSWEKITQANIGLDFGIWRNTLTGSIDVYEKSFSDMYLDRPVSGVNGVFTYKDNGGKMRNRGIEATLRFNAVKTKDFNLSVFANAAYSRNKILSLASEDRSRNIVNVVGEEAWQWQLYRYIGIDKADGQFVYLDQHGKHTKAPTPNDRVLTGKPAYARYSGGFGLDVDYKGFFLTSLFSFQAGGWAYDEMYRYTQMPSRVLEGYNVSRDVLNLPSLNVSETYVGNSDFALFKTDFIRLKNITLGYNLTKEALKNLPISGLKVYIVGENIATWTQWKGFDPEQIVGTSRAVYPNPRTYSLGVNINL